MGIIESPLLPFSRVFFQLMAIQPSHKKRRTSVSDDELARAIGQIVRRQSPDFARSSKKGSVKNAEFSSLTHSCEVGGENGQGGTNASCSSVLQGSKDQ